MQKHSKCSKNGQPLLFVVWQAAMVRFAGLTDHARKRRSPLVEVRLVLEDALLRQDEGGRIPVDGVDLVLRGARRVGLGEVRVIGRHVLDRDVLGQRGELVRVNCQGARVG